MTRLFLSYHREDAGKARVIAQSLEQAGHAVWWDEHIQGGKQFAQEIEQALAVADAVVVLWSARSVQSTWVRDEAAFGRDKGRLMPVRLDGAEPPLGFRQYQNIDLSKWSGQGKPPIQTLVSAIARIGSTEPVQSTGTDIAAVSLPAIAIAKRRSAWIALALILIVVATISAILWKPSKRQAPLVAVVSASSEQADKALTRGLLVKLGVLQAAKAGALQLVDIGARQTPDFIIKVGGADGDSGAKANLMFIDNRAGTLLWSKEFSDPNGNRADLRQQLAYSAAQVLDCATQTGPDAGQALHLSTLKLYLTGCADLSNMLAQEPRAAIKLFAEVTEQAPKFTGGWTKLLLADVQAYRFSGRADQALRKSLRDHIAQARRLNPLMAETFLAEAWLLPPRPIVPWMNLVDRAVAMDPEDPEILSYRSIALANVGLMRKSLEDTRHAVASDPLSPAARDALIIALLNNGEVEAANTELVEAERLWPGATTVLQSRFAVEFREGDPALALRMMRSGELGSIFSSAHPAHEHFLRAKITGAVSDRAQAIQSARAFYGQDPGAAWVYARALAEFGEPEQLIKFLLTSNARASYGPTWVLFRSDFKELHRDPRFMQVAQRFGALDYWSSTDKWPDFCGRPDLRYDCRIEASKLSERNRGN